MRLLREAVHGFRHAVEEEGLGLVPDSVAVWCGDKFLGLGHCKCREEIGEDRIQRATQPNVEEVRQVSVADVVVVGGSVDTTRSHDRTCLLASAWLRPTWKAEKPQGLQIRRSPIQFRQSSSRSSFEVD